MAKTTEGHYELFIVIHLLISCLCHCAESRYCTESEIQTEKERLVRHLQSIIFPDLMYEILPTNSEIERNKKRRKDDFMEASDGR